MSGKFKIHTGPAWELILNENKLLTSKLPPLVVLDVFELVYDGVGSADELGRVAAVDRGVGDHEKQRLCFVVCCNHLNTHTSLKNDRDKFSTKLRKCVDVDYHRI